MEFAPRAEVTRLSGGIACSADGTCSTHRDNVLREVVQAAADWCLPHARGNVSKEAGGRLFNARLFHAGGTFPFPSPTARQCLVCSTRVGNVCMCSMPSFVRGGW